MRGVCMDSSSSGEFRIEAPVCPRCRSPRLIASVNAGLAVTCPACKRRDPLHSLPLSEQNRIRTELASIPSGSSIPRAAPGTPSSVVAVPPFSMPAVPKRIASPRRAREREPSVKRFWLKDQELKLLGQAMLKQESTSAYDADGRLIEVNWHDAESDLARQFRSTLELLRHRKSRERRPRTLWVRPDEVVAARKAMETKKPVLIGEGGEGGRAVYFAPSSAEAQRFRAQLCVERIRR